MKQILSFLSKYKFVAIVIAVVVVGVVVVQTNSAKNKDTEKYIVSGGNIKTTVTASGYIDAKKKADLHFAMPSKVTWIGVKVGDTVRKGQGLASLDRATLQKKFGKKIN